MRAPTFSSSGWGGDVQFWWRPAGHANARGALSGEAQPSDSSTRSPGRLHQTAAPEAARLAAMMTNMPAVPATAATRLAPKGNATWATRLTVTRSEFAVARTPAAVIAITHVTVSVLATPTVKPVDAVAA